MAPIATQAKIMTWGKTLLSLYLISSLSYGYIQYEAMLLFSIF